MPTSPAIEAHGLVKLYGGRRVVDGVDLTVPAGSIFGVLGPNGAGKSTTLRMMLGIVEPDAGTRSVLGDADPRRVVRRTGFLPEERSLYRDMKASSCIGFMGALRGMTWRSARDRGVELLDGFGLGDVAHKRIRRLSKGQAQLVQLVCSIVHSPDLLVLDEPFSGLDPINQGIMERIILQERDRGATIVFSTHVMGHAERICDRLAIIADARVRFEGTVDEARSLLPPSIRWRPEGPAERARDIVPPDARLVDGEWHLDGDDVAGSLEVIRASGLGVAMLSIEKASLHDAFVTIVGENGGASL